MRMQNEITSVNPPAGAAPPAAANGTRAEGRRGPLIAFAVITILGIAAPWLGLYPVFVMKALCLALFASAFNLLLGFAGLLSFGHAIFLAAAGYAAGYAVTAWSLPTVAGVLFGTAVAAALGLLIGAIAIRRQGIYFAMITLALAQMIYFFFLEAKFTGGEDGLQGIPRGTLLGAISLNNDLTMYYFVLAVFIAGLLAIFRIIHSPFGQVLKAIRENEPRTLSLGYRVDHYKLLAFVLSAGLAGLAGAMKAFVLGFETLTDATWQLSGEVVLMTLVGGVGTMFGPMIGAFAIVGLEDRLADQVGSWVQVILGVIFVLCVLTFRRGIVGEFSAWIQRARSRARDAGSR
jgi:branched-chain amino acid transport system permease protein